MWPALISAGLGGYEAYRRSGGDLGATLLGTGLGAVAPAGLRMAGQALGATPLGVAALGKGSELLAKGAAAAKLPGPVAPLTAAALGTATAGLGGLVAPAIAGKVASAATQPIRQLTGGGMSLAAGQKQPSGAYPSGPAVPVMDQYGNVHMYGSTPLDIYSPTGAFQTSLQAQQLATEAQLKALKTIEPYKAEMAEKVKQADLQRQLASAGIRLNQQTQADILRGSVGTAQQMGQIAAQQIGQGMFQTHQYM